MSELALLSCMLFVMLTLFTALMERKLLIYAQSRMGPTLMGRNGALQIVADVMKLLTKEIFMIPSPTSALTPMFLSLLLTTQLLFSLNIAWGPSMLLIDSVDSMMLYHLVLMLLSNIFMTIVGLLSQSSYAMMAMVSGLVHVMSLDIFMTVMYSMLVLSSQSANFHDFVVYQSVYWYLVLYTPASAGFMTVLFLESKRAPFDHSETEAEVVCGYATEYSGSMYFTFMVCEYIHLLMAAIQFLIFFAGGWMGLELFNLLPPIFASYHESYYYMTLFYK